MKLQTSETGLVSEIPFRLESISPVPDPEGGSTIWHRYIIIQGSNTITGMRCGTRAELVPQLEEMVERLNERFGKKLAKAKR